MIRKEFLRSLGLVAFISIIPKSAVCHINTETRYHQKIIDRTLKAHYTIELCQDMKCIYGDDTETELLRRIHEECVREIGTERGTVRFVRAIDDKTWQPKIHLIFRNDGRHGPEDGWNMASNLAEYETIPRSLRATYA